jgi:hypothetical protein
MNGGTNFQIIRYCYDDIAGELRASSTEAQILIMIIVWLDACHSAAEVANDANCHAAAASSGPAALISNPERPPVLGIAVSSGATTWRPDGRRGRRCGGPREVSKAPTAWPANGRPANR